MLDLPLRFFKYSHQDIPQSVPGYPDICAIKSRMKAVREDGDYAAFAKFMEDGAIEAVESRGIEPGQSSGVAILPSWIQILKPC